MSFNMLVAGETHSEINFDKCLILKLHSMIEFACCALQLQSNKTRTKEIIPFCNISISFLGNFLPFGNSF